MSPGEPPASPRAGDAELLEAARSAARAASELLRGARPQEVRAKTNPRDLVTEWDLRSEEVIRRVLDERTPGIPVLGEEGGQGTQGAPTGGDRRWLVDPIDGTVNFAHGLPIWAISISLEDAGELAVGVVAAPPLGWWFEAARGGGAHDGAGRPLRVSAISALDHALLVTGFPYDRATRPDNNFAEWEHLQRRAGACRRLGAAALDLCLVASGSMDGYWERHLKPWDVGAGALIVAEAGGTVTDWTGRRFDVHEGAVVATNGAIHEELVAELGRVRRPATCSP
ncbi:MAG TPA: inositol monophosphatase family protein [Kofleriaceae bacterium]|nr:inositol monophosphatase family protein [Kofleriaceae bacterium]